MQESNTTDTPTPVPTISDSGTKKPGEGWRSVLSTIGILLIAPLVAVFLTAFVFQSYQVDGPSMQTTLQNNDRLLVWKLSRTWARVTGNPYTPKRGDVIIFNETQLGIGNGQSKQLIKRVLALPGEKVRIEDGRIIVFNTQHPQGFQPDAELAYGQVIGDTQPESEDTSWTLTENQIFVAGDNRADSLDSRAFGPIELDDVVGKLMIRILPLNTIQRF